MKRLVSYFGTVFLILVMAICAFAVIAPHFGWHIDYVLSDSMAPTFKRGNIVVTRPAEPGNIRAGDIITYRSPLDGKVATHRVAETRLTEGGQTLFQTKGDANEDVDPYAVPPQNLVGRVWFHLPLPIQLAEHLKDQKVLLLAMVLPAVIIIVMEMRNIWRIAYGAADRGEEY